MGNLERSQSALADDQFIEHARRNPFENNNTKIKNPLKHIPKNALKAQVENFAAEHGLSDYIDVFIKGALVAQAPGNYDNIHELDEQNCLSLRKEDASKWHQPRALWFTIIVCSIGAAVQGWDQAGSNGANLSFPKAFGIGSNSAHDQWIVGLVNAAPTIAQAFIRCWLSDPINDLIGRRGAIFIAGCFSFCSCIGSALTQTWPQLFVCRLILGIGMGIKASTTSVYAAENSPAQIRGALAMTWQLYVAFGIFLGFSANLAVVDIGTIAWRLQLGSAFIPAIPLLFSVFFCPESPRWLVKKGRYREAFASPRKLRFTEVQAARDLYSMYVQFNQEQHMISTSGKPWNRFGQLFTIRRIRRANLAASIVMLAQQMCGINIISFYSSSVFTEAGVSEKNALWASWGFGLTTFLFAIPALKTIDTFGRRSLLLAAFPWMRLAFTPTGAFGFYCGLNLIAFVMIFLWVPETKELTLEELDYVFAVPSARFVKHQVTEYIPDATPPILYDFSEARVTHARPPHSGDDGYTGTKVTGTGR
ncbi:hypothetical protein BDV26DRAFT_285653 [Aspergillus bertholletiae]|uniref:Major facilitator superfamily (MFS) profile domain-containing protein n=1 Tax=Aspergillus bertholletiae TaxID=1226010 RepID=A0A5N7ASF2_9EURO|nr:hypothetical protein BDV26DRAFT_285653 [Aspergillus bertholletiae]